jgi:hypothetical protein
MSSPTKRLEFSYDVETKQQSSHWKSPALPCPKKARRGIVSESNDAFFFIIETLCIMNLFLKINQDFYLAILRSVGYDLKKIT